MERQDNRPRVLQQQTGPKPPMTSILEYPITYWGDTQFGTSGLKNMGNTCYMNSTIQCLSATAPFATYFKDGTWQRDVNMINPMGTKGRLAQAFANILREMSTSEMQTLTPIPFRVSCTLLCRSLTLKFTPSLPSARFANMHHSSKVATSTIRKSSSNSCWTVCMKT